MRVRLKTLALWTAYTCALLVAVANVVNIRQAIGLDCANNGRRSGGGISIINKRLGGIEPWKLSTETRVASATKLAAPLDSENPDDSDTFDGDLSTGEKKKKTPDGTEPRTLRAQVFILTTWRSGSSFVGELFNQHPGVFYLFEPLWHVWQALYPGDARVLQGASRDMLNSLFRCDLQVFNLYASGQNMTSRDIFRSLLNRALCSPPLCPALPRPRHGVSLVDEKSCSRLCPPRPLADVEAQCRRLPVVVIKGVRIFDLELLAPLLQDPSLNLKISTRLPAMVCGRRGVNVPMVMVVLGALTFAWFVFTDNTPFSFSNNSGIKHRLKQLQQIDGTSSPDGDEADAAVPLDSTPAEMSADRRRLGSRTRTLIMSTWRSGSSFVGQMFSQHPDVFYMFEPAWHVWARLLASNARVLQPACRDMLNQLFRCDASVLDYYVARTGDRDLSSLFMHATSRALCSPPACDAYVPSEISEEKACATACKHQSFDRIGETCAQYKHVVIKEVRFFDLNVLKPLMLDPSLNLKIVNLIRDPRAVALSRDNAPRGLKYDNGIVLERGGQLILDVNYTALKIICDSQADMGEMALVGKQPYWLRGRYRLVRFEDLVKEPRQTVLDLQDFTGVPRNEFIASWVHNLTHGSKSSGDVFFVVPKDAVKVSQKWRLELTFAKVLQVQKACERMMKIFGYRFIRTLGELKSMDVNLIDELKFSVFGH